MKRVRSLFHVVLLAYLFSIKRQVFALRTIVLFFFLSMSVPLSAQMSGTYLIDPAGTGDYTTLSAAVNDLNSSGMSSEVVFRLSTGTYHEKVIIDSVQGNNADNQIIIESQSGNREDVILQYLTNDHDTANYVIRLNKTNGVVIRNITFDNEEASSSYGRIVELTGNVSNVTLEDNHFIGNRNASALFFGYGSGGNNSFFEFDSISNVTVTRNLFNYFSPAISGTSLYSQEIYHENITVDANEFIDADGVGIANTSGVYIGNNISYGVLYKVHPIKLQACAGEIIIEKNIAYRTIKGIELSFFPKKERPTALIRNNFFSGDNNLIELLGISNLNVANNTFTGTTNSDYLLYIYEPDSLDMYNNIFYQQAEGPVLSYFNIGNLTADNNCYYAPNGFLGFNLENYTDSIKTIEDFQTKLGIENNGLNIDPNIATDTTYRALALDLIDGGVSLDYITEDIEGEPRVDGSPDIGADEASTTSNLTITAIQSGSSTVNIDEGLTITWQGQNAGETTFDDTWQDEIYLSTDTDLDESDVLLGFKINNETLNPSDTYSFSKTFVVDVPASGDYYVLVNINSDNGLSEDRTDNLLAGPIVTVNFTNRPNLIVSDITLPTDINSGAVISFDWTVTNNGDQPSEGKWDDYIYFSSDSLLLADHENMDPEKDFIAKIESPVGIAPGESYTNTHQFKLPLRGSGKYYVKVVTDFDDSQKELDESLVDNSKISQAVSISQSPLADLVITDLNFPETAFSGEHIDFSYTIRNVGSDKTSYDRWTDYVYITTDSIPDEDTFTENWKKRKRIPRWKELEQDEEFVFSESISLPYCEADTFYIHMVLDVFDEVLEIADDNNIYVSTHSIIAIQKPSADLVIERLSFDSENFESGEPVGLSYDIYNRGFDIASIFNNLREGVYLSEDEVFDKETDVELSSRIFLDTLLFEVGQSLTREQRIWFPDSIYGEYYIVVNTDDPDIFCEVPYEDNNAYFSEKINIELAPVKDLVIENLELETSGVAGEQLTLQYNVSNHGEGVAEKTFVIDSLFLVPVGEEPSEKNKIWFVEREDFRLPANDTRLEDLYFKIPVRTKPGDYRIVVKTDATDRIYEHEAEDNNSATSEIIAVTRDDNKLADLNVGDIGLPNEIGSGETIVINATVENLSTKKTNTDEWKYHVRLLDDDEKVIASENYNHFDFIEGSSSIDREDDFEIPNGISGDFKLVYLEDSQNKVTEYYETNNADTLDIEIMLSPWADLVAVNFSHADSLIAGQLASMSWDILNQGEAVTKSDLISNKIYLSEDNLLDDEDILLSKESVTSVIQPTTSISQTIDFRVNTEVEEGYYFLLLKTDATDQEYEHTNEANNLVTSIDEVYIVKPNPVDLAPWPASIDLFSNSQIVTYAVSNTSANTAYGSWVDAAFLSTDEVWDKDDILLGYETINVGEEGLAPGESYDARIRSQAGFVKPDDYYVIVKADVYNYIPELNTGNNNRSSTNSFYVDLIEELIPNEVKDSVFYQNRGRTHYYKLNTSTDNGYLLTLDGKNSNNKTELYHKVEDLPGRGGNFDFKGANNFQEFQQIIIPSKDSVTTDYTLAYGDYIFGETMDYTLLAEEKEFSIVNITPEFGGNEGIIVMDINGFDFSDSLRAIIRNDVDSIEAVHSYALSSIKARAHFNLNQMAPGSYDVVLQRLDRGDETVLEQQFTVQDTSYTDYYMTVTGPDRVRVGNDFIAQLNFANVGNINDYDVLILCAFYLNNHPPEDFSIDYLGDGISDKLPNELQPLHPFTNETLISDDRAYYFYTWVPVFAAQSSGQFTFKFNIDLIDSLNISAQFFANPISDIHFTGNLDDLLKTAFMQELDSIFSNGQFDQGSSSSGGRVMNGECIDDPEVVEAMIWKGVRAHAEYVGGGIPGNRTDVVSTLLQEGLKSLIDPEAHNHAEDVAGDLIDERREIVLDPTKKSAYDHLIKNLDNCLSQDPDLRQELDQCLRFLYKTDPDNGRQQHVYSNTCKERPPQNAGGGKSIPERIVDIVNSLDPNEILGPEGTGDPRYITSQEELRYRINFENVEEASAAAQRVAIDNKLQEEFDERTFRLKEIGWNDTTIQLPNSAFFSGTFDLGPAYDNHQLHLTAGLDPVNKQVFWRFQTIDPATGGPPNDPDAGFLPPNDSTGVGEGYVSYAIYARDGLSGGTELKNEAVIVFDQEKSLTTNEWVNTIQAEGLDSYVLELPAETDTTSFVVSWAPNEAFNSFQPDITDYSIYVSENDSSYYIWQKNTAETEAIFTGKVGHSYEFFSIARSHGGNEEYAPNVADASTVIKEKSDVTGLDEEKINALLQNKSLVIYPNPSANSIHIAYNLKTADKLSLVVTNLVGKTMARVELGHKKKGVNKVLLTNLSSLPGGLYIVEIEGANFKETGRWLKY